MLLLRVLRASDGLNRDGKKQLDKQGDIDRGYYNNMVDEAIKSLSVYGDFERFAADEPYVSDNTPPWFGAGEPHEDDTTPFDVR